MEAKADEFARDTLMNARDYKEFVMKQVLQPDEILGWGQYNEKIVYYKLPFRNCVSDGLA